MSRKSIKFTYDQDVDAAYLKLASGKVLESEEVKPGLIVDFDSQGNILGVEILRFAKRFLAESKSKSLRKSA